MRPIQKPLRAAGPATSDPGQIQDPAVARAIGQLNQALAALARALPTRESGEDNQVVLEVLTRRSQNEGGKTKLFARKVTLPAAVVAGVSDEYAVIELATGGGGTVVQQTVNNVTQNISNLYTFGLGA